MYVLKMFLRELLVYIYLRIPLKFEKIFTKRKITILLYHEISPKQFEKHVKFLRLSYNFISFEQLKKVLYEETEEILPINPIVITFDDGWRSNFELLSVIKKYNVPVTIFLTMGLIGTNRKIWNWAIDRVGKEQNLNTRLKNISNKKKNYYLFKNKNFYNEKEFNEREFLSLKEIDLLKPYVDFQSHGMFHPVYTMCDDDELRYDMRESKKKLQKIIGKKCYAISYPYGRYDKREMLIAKETGYFMGRTANNPGINTVKSDPFSLKALGIDKNHGIKELRKTLAWGNIITIKEYFVNLFTKNKFFHY